MTTVSLINDIDLDGILVEIGELGRHQLLNYAILCVAVIMTSSSYLNYIFSAGQVDYRCRVPECEQTILNHTSVEYLPNWLEFAVPFNEKEPAKCARYQLAVAHPNAEGQCSQETFNRSAEIKCNDFVYKNDEVTILNEFNVTCEENEWKLALVGSLSYIAEIIALPICAVLSDKYGRRPVLIFTILLSGTCGIIKSFSTSYVMFATMQFITAIASGSTYMTIFVMAIELSGPSKRVFSGALISAIYSASQVVAGIVAMYFHNFRDFLRVLFIPHLIALTFIWLIPESVRWLLTKGKLAQAQQIIFHAAKMNGVTLAESTKKSLYNAKEIQLDSNSVETVIASSMEPVIERRNPFLVAIRSRSLILRLLNCLFCWFTTSFIYYGLSINSMALAGSKYVNYILVNLVEVPAVLLSYYLMDKIGRKKTLCSTLLLSGIACVVSEFVAENASTERLILFIIGKCGITVSFTILYVFSSELFPTYVRQSFMSACSTVGSVGSMIAPQTPLLIHYWSALPLLLFGGTAVLSGFFVLLLPETLNSKLPDTVEEAEQLGNSENN